MIYMKRNTLHRQETSAGLAEACVFPPSVQSDLFSYLKPWQQEFVKPLLRVLKKPAQAELCDALMDYLETGQIDPPQNIALGGLYYFITQKMCSLHSR